MAYSQVGYYFVMRKAQDDQKRFIKEKIYNKLTNDELEMISFTDYQQQIYWEEEGKEFLFKGEMYDVVKSKTVNGKVMLYCINDKKEKLLVEHYNAITKHNSTSDKKAKGNPDNSINLFVYQENPELNYRISTSNSFLAIVSHLADGIADETSPPPKA